MPLTPEPKIWLIVASRDHIQWGVTGGFAQVNHGKSGPLQRMTPGDWVLYYSPKLEYGKPAPCQKFTAAGQVQDSEIYAHDMGNGFVPFRRNVTYAACHEAPIQPLIPDLSFIHDKQYWGAPFRFGILKIPLTDFERIAAAMQVIV